jgi:hypothetical protein
VPNAPDTRRSAVHGRRLWLPIGLAVLVCAALALVAVDRLAGLVASFATVALAVALRAVVSGRL